MQKNFARKTPKTRKDVCILEVKEEWKKMQRFMWQGIEEW